MLLRDKFNTPYESDNMIYHHHAEGFCAQLDKFSEYSCNDVMSNSWRQLLLYVLAFAEDP